MTKPPPTCPSWQETKRLSSGDKIWILTDVETSTSSFLPWSTEQRWYTVGAYDFRTECIGFFRFSLDDAKGLLRAGLAPPPWNSSQSHGVEVFRLAHEDGEEKGRFVVRGKLFDIASEVKAIEPTAKTAFWHAGLTPNATPDMWEDLVDLVTKEKRIEAAILGTNGMFTANDVALLVPGDNYSPILQRLVKEGRVERFGRARGTQYRVR